jgi:hypothetical protein
MAARSCRESSHRACSARLEDRFGARLIDVGYADIRLLVERPPRTLAAAQRIAAEHVVFADECIDGFRQIPNILIHTNMACVDANTESTGCRDRRREWCPYRRPSTGA